MVHGSIDYDLEHLTRCHRVFFWSFCIIFCSFHNIIIHPEPFFAKKFGFFLLLCHRLGKQKQLLASGVANGGDSCIAWNHCYIFITSVGPDLWYKEQTTCVLLLNFRTFMETPFALNSLPLRQRARWRVRSQVS